VNEADRIAREKVLRAQAEQDQAAADRAATYKEALDLARRDVESLIPAALASFAKEEYVGVQEIEFSERGKFGRTRKLKKGAWQIASVSSMHFGIPTDFPVYLTSDGKLVMYRGAISVKELYETDHLQKDLLTIAEALRARARYSR
jgi:hypothetical protein